MTMRNVCLALLFCFCCLHATVIFAQMPPSKTKEVAAKVALLPIQPGEWIGKGYYQFGPNRQEVDQYEKISSVLDGSVLLIEGIGRQNGEVRHHAVGTLSYDPFAQKYMLRTFKDGYTVDADAELKEDGSFIWSMKNPRGITRYTVRLIDGTWLETGDFSADEGKTWSPFLEMKLQKK